MADDVQRPIIIRRSRRVDDIHHGGAWKIAYADFVTAMMAFFLLMWLLSSATHGELEGIAEYFKRPIQTSMSGGVNSGERSSIIPGGGQDLTRREHQVKRGEIIEKKTVNLKASQAELDRLKELKEKLERAIEASPTLREFKHQILLDITSEGLRIQIVDDQNRPMFALGRAELQPYTRAILFEIAKLLNEMPNRVSLSGHTDATPYSGGEAGYSNWELSADRANASRRALVAGGVGEGKIMHVVGLASAVLFDPENPTNPVNRRISIIVMNKRTEHALTSEGPAVQVEGASELDIRKIAPDAAG